MEEFGGLIAFVAGWLLAQLGKMLIALAQGKGLKGIAESVTKSGGMPSGHTSSFMALSMYFGMKNGFTSDIFVLAICMTAIIVYDAVNVRKAVGEQAKVLVDIVTEHKCRGKKLKVVEGHTVLQVIIGGLLGILVGWLTFIILQ